MLALTSERAQLRDGDQILELGCGWGSLTLWMAAHFPNARITAVSNSRTQKQFIDARAANVASGTSRSSRGTPTCSSFRRSAASTASSRSKCSSTCATTRRCSGASPAGCVPGPRSSCTYSRTRALPIRSRCVTKATGWRAISLPVASCRATTCCSTSSGTLRSATHWRVSGTHYQKTSEAGSRTWTGTAPGHAGHFGDVRKRQARRWWVYWRVFFMSCAELFGYRGARGMARLPLPLRSGPDRDCIRRRPV